LFQGIVPRCRRRQHHPALAAEVRLHIHPAVIHGQKAIGKSCPKAAVQHHHLALGIAVAQQRFHKAGLDRCAGIQSPIFKQLGLGRGQVKLPHHVLNAVPREIKQGQVILPQGAKHLPHAGAEGAHIWVFKMHHVIKAAHIWGLQNLRQSPYPVEGALQRL
jgi:hypothetical protein